MSNDPYSVLGLSSNATDEQLQSAFRTLALRWHPDRNSHRNEEATVRFKQISQAYQDIKTMRSRYNSNSQKMNSDKQQQRQQQQHATYFYSRTPYADPPEQRKARFTTQNPKFHYAHGETRTKQQSRSSYFNRINMKVKQICGGATFFVVSAMALVTVTGMVNPLWKIVNKGKSFEEFQAKRIADKNNTLDPAHKH